MLKWQPEVDNRLIDPSQMDEESPKEYPFAMAGKALESGLEREKLFLAWELSRLAAKDSEPLQQRALIILILALLLAAAEGSTRLALSVEYIKAVIPEALLEDKEEQGAVGRLLEKLQTHATGNADLGELGNLFGYPGDYKPLIIDQQSLYIQKLYVLEQRVAEKLLVRITATGTEIDADSDLEKALQNVISNPPSVTGGKLTLDSEQVDALRKSFQGRLTVISGRPGSGKTSIVASLLRIMTRMGFKASDIALAAPTGKAADRLNQSIANHLAAIAEPDSDDLLLKENLPTSSTLHRLLGYSPSLDRFRHNQINPLPEKIVIIDESSMIDLTLFDSLLRALDEQVNLVLLGDADQLPSVEAGAVLRDLCQSSEAITHQRVAVLEKSYRTDVADPAGAQIMHLAEVINRGEPVAAHEQGSLITSRETAGALSFNGVEQLVPKSINEHLDFYEHWLNRLQESLSNFDSYLEQVYLVDDHGFNDETLAMLNIIVGHYEHFKLLAVTRSAAGGRGAEAINSWFHQQWRTTLRKKDSRAAQGAFLPGEPVIINRNSYHLQLFNGDSGLILNVSTDAGERHLPPTPLALFPRAGSFAAYPLEALYGRLEHAWVTTVHKAQGSEYDHIALLLPDVEVRTLSRELLYTAVTRARKSVTLVGSPQIFEAGIRKTAARSSGLSELLG